MCAAGIAPYTHELRLFRRQYGVSKQIPGAIITDAGNISPVPLSILILLKSFPPKLIHILFVFAKLLLSI